ncbi:DUF5372 family protein [Desulfosporosinus acidiphilus]|uniref:DUF5372 family protein n=1 Tax=Desulfosporosinus acidiphilus TaxID=885581 RepID=UPI003CFE2834
MGCLTITHPFHPLKGQTFKILQVRKVYGVRLYSVVTESGSLSVPESWTDHDPLSVNPSDMNFPLDAFVLRDLLNLSSKLKDKTLSPSK